MMGSQRNREDGDAIGARRRTILLRLAAGIAIVALLVAGYFVLANTDALALLGDSTALRERIDQLGLLGPVAVIAMMATAIVLNPIPSAPIAMAAGAAFGHAWGTLYIVTGAEIGALTAFGIARLLGCGVLPRLARTRDALRLIGSQNALMGIVFVSRLLPFVSFDLVSYAAGLTPLATWRFALATLAGIVPASFLLAHLGGELASSDLHRVAITVLALGAITVVPIVVHALRTKRRASRSTPPVDLQD